MKKLIVFLVIMTTIIVLLFIYDKNREQTEYSDVFFGLLTDHQPTGAFNLYFGTQNLMT